MWSTNGIPREQRDNREAPTSEVLLKLKLGIGRDEDCEAFALGGIEQLAVLQL